MASGNYPFVGNAQTFQNDFAINNAYPGIEYGGTESGALYYEDREIGGTKYFNVQNATFNKVSQSWVAINPTLPCYAMALTSAGTWEFLSVPAGNSPFTTWTVVYSVDKNGNASFTTTQTALASNVDLSGLSVYNVKHYGAKGDGVTDDTAAIKAAIAAVQLTAGGIVYFPTGTYIVSDTLTVSKAGVWLVGNSWITTVIQAAAGTFATSNNLVQFTGTVGGNTFTQLVNVGISGLQLYQPNATTTACALSLYYTANARVYDVQCVGQWIEGIIYQRATNTITERCITFYTGTVSHIGFDCNGSSGSGGGAGDVYGNVSSVFRDCAVDCSSVSTALVTVAFRNYASAAGGNCADVMWDNCASAQCQYGWNINLTNTSGGNNDNDSDLQLINPICDRYTLYGINYVGNTDASSELQILGGWFNPYRLSTGNLIGINATARGLTVVGAEFYPLPSSFANTSTAINASSSNLKVTNCNFSGQTYFVTVNGGSNVALIGNEFFGSTVFGIKPTAAVNLVSGAAITVLGNTFEADNFNGIATAISIGASALNVIVVGNTLSSNCTTLISNSSPSAQIGFNTGYNPTGAAVPDASVGASPWTYTNSTGVTITAYITGGTVSGISIDGRNTGATSGTFVIPPGKAMILTYTVAPTVHFVGD